MTDFQGAVLIISVIVMLSGILSVHLERRINDLERRIKLLEWLSYLDDEQ